MIKNMLDYFKKPELYAKSPSKLWDDDHISKGMLESHLHPETGASRSHEFMDRSVDWIAGIAPANKYNKLLDLGCGPGLYGERLVKRGYSITGIDFSKRSIAYAKDKAKERGEDITYIYNNYLEIEYDSEFDVAILIYCDYGVLIPNEREILLRKIYRALKKGGKLIFDVFTPKQREDKKEGNTWYLEEGGGFWKPDTNLCLESHYIYDGYIRLDQYVVIDINDKVEVIRVWEHLFTMDLVKAELEKAGFTNIEFFGDAAGGLYQEDSNTLCMVVTK